MDSKWQIEKASKKGNFFYFFASSFFWHENRSNAVQYIIEIISNLQLVAIILSGLSLSRLNPLEGSLPSLIQKTVKVFTLIDVSILRTDTNLMNIIFLFICFYFFLFLILIFFLLFKHTMGGQISKLMHIVITYWTQCHHSIFFWILDIFLFSVFTNNTSKKIFVFGIEEPNNGLRVGTGVLILFNHVFGLLGATFCFDPFLTNNVFSSYTPTFQFTTFLHKTFTSPLSVFVSDVDTLKWVFTGFNLIFSVIRYELLLRETLFYHFSAMRSTALMSACALAFSTTNVINIILAEYEYIQPLDAVYIEGSTLLLVLQLTMSRVVNIVRESFCLKDGRHLTQVQILKKIIAFTYFADRANFSLNSVSRQVCNEALLQLAGNYSSHNNSCTDSKCVCHYLVSERKSLRTQLNNLFKVQEMNNESKANLQFKILSDTIRNSKEHNTFNILAAYLMARDHKNFAAALFTLFEVNQKQKTIQQEILVFYVTRILEEEVIMYYQAHEDHKFFNMNLKKAIDFEFNFEELSGFIKKNVRSYIELWDYFQKPRVNLGNFLQKSGQVEQQDTKIQKLWDSISESYQNIPKHTYVLYCVYLMVVRNLPCKADDIYDHYSNKDFERNHIDHVPDDVDDKYVGSQIMCYISMARERLGRILYISNNIIDELGWSQSDLIGRNIKVIQAPFIAEKHDQILLRHIEGSKPPMGEIFDGFAQDVKGYIVPVGGGLNIFPYVQKEPIYAGVLRRRNITRDFLIVRRNGAVDSFSARFAKKLDLIPGQKIHISEICPSFDNIRTRLFEIALKNSRSQGQNQQEMVFLFQYSAKEIMCITKIDIYTVQQESFFCLSLSMKKTQRESSQKLMTKIPLTDQNTFDDLTPMPAAEFDTFSNRVEMTKRTDSLLSPELETKTTQSKKHFLPKTFRKKMENVNTLGSNKTNNQGSLDFNGQIRLNSKEILKLGDGQAPSSRNLLETQPYMLTDQDAKNLTVDELTLPKGKKDLNAKMEQAMYYIPAERFMRLMNYTLFVFVIVCISVVIFHLIHSNHQLNLLIQKIETISICETRTFALVSVNLYTRMLALITAGIISETRHLERLRIQNWSSEIKNKLLSVSETLNESNDILLFRIYELESSALDKVKSNPLTIDEEDSSLPVRSVKRFQLILQVASMAKTLVKTEMSNITLENPSVRFILDNTLNDLLIASEYIIYALEDDYRLNLEQIGESIIFLALIILSFGSSILCVLSVDMRKSAKKRDNFMEMLLKIEESKLKDHLKLVSKFESYLKDNIFNLYAHLEIKNNILKLQFAHDSPRMKKKSRYGNKKGLNRRMMIGLLFTILIILAFVSIFGILGLNFKPTMTDCLQKRDRLIEITDGRNNLVLLKACMLAYISEGSSLQARNLPIEEQMSQIFEDAKSYPDTFIRFLSSMKEEQIGLTQMIIEGDLCSVITIPNIPSSVCQKLAEIIGVKGLVRLISVFLKSQTQIKSSYDQSNHTVQAAYEAYAQKEEVVNEEIILFGLKAIELMQIILKDDLTQTLVNYKSELRLLVVFYSLICIALGCILSFKVWRGIREERDSWRKILRQIPFSIISSNKAIKAFLVNNSDKILDKVKTLI